ncbi:unnamed protein product [Leptidea sinapis]|uniref:Uncharacterized protein n=1 Tax=Leptidea sinapis TaxID=189913 RepID=A0A5E4R545_9NEOP|nr:unnamed protein product [Leptidea sinapis]
MFLYCINIMTEYYLIYQKLEARTFVTRDWYKKYQDIITPAGLAFYQTIWDSSFMSMTFLNLTFGRKNGSHSGNLSTYTWTSTEILNR